MNIIKDYFIWQASSLETAYKGSLVEKHNGDTGQNRETILRDWLIRHLPRKVTPELGGKIIDQQENITKQLDIIIHSNDVPHFGAFPKSYFFVEGVSSVLEVKSVLTSKTLQDAVQNLATVKICRNSSPGSIIIGQQRVCPRTGIFAYETNYKSIEKIVTALQRYENGGIPPVDFVCINRKAYIPYNKGEWAGNIYEKEKVPFPKGYIIADQSEECIWRMLLSVASEAQGNIASFFDFQKYFINQLEPLVQQK